MEQRQSNKIEERSSSFNTNNVTSPLSASRLVAKVNSLSTPPSKARRVLPNMPVKQKSNVDYKSMVDKIAEISNIKDINSYYFSIHKILTQYLDCSFTAFGLYNETSQCINLKLFDKLDNVYSSKVFGSDSTNPVSQSFYTRRLITKDNVDFLNLAYFHGHKVSILPMISVNKCIGVMLIADRYVDQSEKLYNFIANHVALITDNFDLVEKSNERINTDGLTQLYNHRGFQECLSKELRNAEETNSKLSIVMLDVNNISKINKEFGHIKGDEVIKLVAEKVKHNLRKTDIAGRYGGDEIAMILPNTDVAEAKYIAEYITYSLSCCFVDDVGPVKVAVGIASYPECAREQEKLLILSEQAMYISQAKGYKDGMSAIISSTDFNFWDDAALKSYAEIISKRHSQMGVNFEEELLHKFNSEQISSQNHLSEIATSLAGAIDAKDPYTKGHSTSVSRYSEALARALNLPENEVERITLGALLHDVGKIGIPENVLKKPDKLSDEEWGIMKQHPVIGAEKVLQPNEALRDLIPIVKYHHEHVDGSGYPEKLKGDQIPLSAKIVAVADAFHALVSDRPYRKGLGLETACDILLQGAGKQWDSGLVRKFIQIAPSLITKI
ncbi:MAG: diguanylate cyclase [Candidatus Gastranaerophilales bacterium]|nr:diguanylate cyclase [Candidatus Gastranaerophilales bacterium]